jgi:hypothetical protein
LFRAENSHQRRTAADSNHMIIETTHARARARACVEPAEARSTERVQAGVRPAQGHHQGRNP